MIECLITISADIRVAVFDFTMALWTVVVDFLLNATKFKSAKSINVQGTNRKW